MDQAIQKTISYNDSLLKKVILHSQIQKNSSLPQELKPVLLGLRSSQLAQLSDDLKTDASHLVKFSRRGDRNEMRNIQTSITNENYLEAMNQMDALLTPEEPDWDENERELQQQQNDYFNKLFKPLKDKIQAIGLIKEHIKQHNQETFSTFKDKIRNLRTKPNSSEPSQSLTDVARNIKNR